jgi:hypothetical protein
MAFTLANWGCQQPALNAGQETVVPYGGSSTVENTCNVFTYSSPNDAVATIIAANYFDPVKADLSVNDIIWGNGTDASFAVQVTAVSPHVTVASMGLTTSIGTANIVDDAVTYAKLQDAAAGGSLIGEPTSTPGAEYQEVTLGAGLVFNSASITVDPAFLNLVEISMTAAQWNGMYATPVQVIAAPGANKAIIVEEAVLNMTFVSASYAAGGAVGLQYGNSAHLAGAPASATEAATDFTSAAASTLFRFVGGLSTGALVSAAVNTAVYISNATAAFTTGDGTWKVRVWYRVIPTNS